MPDIFLSYASKDREVTRRFAEAFEVEGFSVWWDSALRSGEAYDERIEMALRGAKAVVVLWSKTSVESRWVRAEATLADRNRTLAPCLIEPCERPIMFELTHTADLTHWNGERDDKAWRAFVGDVRRIVSGERAPEQPSVSLPPPSVKETTRAGDKSGSAPSLAVLPFTNRSPVEDDEIFAEGMVEDIILALSQGAGLRVLGSTATAGFRKGAITDLAAVGRQLGVGYLLEGNVRRVADNLRVTTQLLEAATGAVVWTGKFDRPLSELAALQEELVLEVAANLDAQVQFIEMERALRKPGDITAWEANIRSFGAVRDRLDPTSLAKALQEAERAATIAPDFAPAQGQVGWAQALLYMLASPDDPKEVKRIRAILERAAELGVHNHFVSITVAQGLCYLGDPEEAHRHVSRAVRMAPGNGWAHFTLGMASAMLNRFAEAMKALDTAARLMPGVSWLCLIRAYQANVRMREGRWSEAEALCDEGLSAHPEYTLAWQNKAVVRWRLGEREDAQDIVERLASRGEWGPTTHLFMKRGFAGSPNYAEIVEAVDALQTGADAARTR